MDVDARALWLSRNILPYELHIRRIINKWKLPDGLDAEDIIQEAYAKISALHSVSHITAPKGYFFQVARSILLMHIRRAKLVSIEVIANLEQLHMGDDGPSPEVQISDRQQLRLLANTVAQIGEPHRSVFILRIIHEVSYKTIGQTLGLSENAAQKMFARTLNSLAEKIGRSGNDRPRASKHIDSKRDQRI